MATADEIKDIINTDFEAHKKRADDALSDVKQNLDEAKDELTGLRVDYVVFGENPADVTTADIQAPTFVPTDFSTDVKDAFSYAFNTHNADLQPQVLNFLDQFFPDISGAIRTGSDNWIIDTIANGRGMPASVEDAIWNRERDRETQEAARAEQSAIDAAASRGFSMPPGALAAAITANQTELAKKNMTLGRDIAIKSFDLTNENMRFAIQQAIGLRTAFVSALGDFIKVAMAQPSQAVDYAKTILAAKTGLYDTAVRLYSAQIAEEELRTSVEAKNRQLELGYNEFFLKGRSTMVEQQIRIAESKAKAATDAAGFMADVAARSLQTRNAMLNLSGAA